MSRSVLTYWRRNLFGLLLCFALAGLGNWQLQRGFEKKALETTLNARMQQAPLHLEDLKQRKDVRFYQAKLRGEFDNTKTILLDNRTHEGHAGYEIVTPFHVQGAPFAILVDRGFIALPHGKRTEIPIIKNAARHEIHGLLNLPPKTYAAPTTIDQSLKPFLRVQTLDLPTLTQSLGYPLFPNVLQLAENDPNATIVKWQAATTSAQKHFGYAVQWFALSITLLVLLVALNYRRVRHHD